MYCGKCKELPNLPLCLGDDKFNHRLKKLEQKDGKTNLCILLRIFFLLFGKAKKKKILEQED